MKSITWRGMMLLLGLLFGSGVVHGQLAWDKTELGFTPPMEQIKVVAPFRFTNSGKYPLTIREVKSDRDCVVTALSQHTYRPGDSGVIEVAFQFARLPGKHVRTIAVVTDENQNAVTSLTISVTIPEVLSIQPAMVRWEPGEKPEPKTIVIKTLREIDVKVLGVQASSGRIKFKSELKEVQAGKEYTLTLTPEDTGKPGMVMWNLQSNLPAEVSSRYRILSAISSSPAKPSPPASQPSTGE